MLRLLRLPLILLLAFAARAENPVATLEAMVNSTPIAASSPRETQIQRRYVSQGGEQYFIQFQLGGAGAATTTGGLAELWQGAETNTPGFRFIRVVPSNPDVRRPDGTPGSSFANFGPRPLATGGLGAAMKPVDYSE